MSLRRSARWGAGRSCAGLAAAATVVVTSFVAAAVGAQAAYAVLPPPPPPPPSPTAAVDPSLAGALPGQMLHVIVQARTRQLLGALQPAVDALGGSLRRTLSIVDGIAADVPAGALQALAGNPAVQAIAATLTAPNTMVVFGTLGSQHFRIDAFEGAKKVPSTYRLRLTDGFDTATFTTLTPDVEIITP
jgi:hypothetical protein